MLRKYPLKKSQLRVARLGISHIIGYMYHPKKPGKIRIVFDCSAEHKGVSPSTPAPRPRSNNLIGVLCRFRQERVALTCDIEGMYHQVKVNIEHRNFLRFLWWDDGSLATDPVEYRMTVHLFGVLSSPGCANFLRKTTAEDFEGDCGSESAKFVKRDFYVDDGIKSVSTVAVAIDLIENTEKLLKCRLFICTSSYQIERK